MRIAAQTFCPYLGNCDALDLAGTSPICERLTTKVRRKKKKSQPKLSVEDIRLQHALKEENYISVAKKVAEFVENLGLVNSQQLGDTVNQMEELERRDGQSKKKKKSKNSKKGGK